MTIERVTVRPLRQITDEKGDVLHMLRNDYELYDGFGEVYFSEIRSAAVKAWRRHRLMTQRLTVPVGRIKLVTFDDRDAGHPELREITLGRPDEYKLVLIPPMVWYGFCGIGLGTALIVNCTDIPHDPDEAEHTDTSDATVPFVWSVQ